LAPIHTLITYPSGAHKRPVKWEAAMADIVYLVVGILFFAVMGLYAHACDRL
jgi:hypothetical protein